MLKISEDSEQIAYMKWAKMNKTIKDLVMHCPNGGSRNVLEAIKLKKMGVSPGFPDIFIAHPKNGFHGLFIELKRQKQYKSSITKNQKEWIENLKSNGYAAYIAFGANEAIKITSEYLHKNNTLP